MPERQTRTTPFPFSLLRKQCRGGCPRAGWLWERGWLTTSQICPDCLQRQQHGQTVEAIAQRIGPHAQKPIPEQDRAQILRQLCAALDYRHPTSGHCGWKHRKNAVRLLPRVADASALPTLTRLVESMETIPRDTTALSDFSNLGTAFVEMFRAMLKIGTPDAIALVVRGLLAASHPSVTVLLVDLDLTSRESAANVLLHDPRLFSEMRSVCAQLLNGLDRAIAEVTSDSAMEAQLALVAATPQQGLRRTLTAIEEQGIQFGVVRRIRETLLATAR
jgi:hypothetical protein